jgi:hypothetical protein
MGSATLAQYSCQRYGLIFRLPTASYQLRTSKRNCVSSGSPDQIQDTGKGLKSVAHDLEAVLLGGPTD